MSNIKSNILLILLCCTNLIFAQYELQLANVDDFTISGENTRLCSRGLDNLNYVKGMGVSSWSLCLATGDSPISFGKTKSLIDEKSFFGTGGDVHCLSKSKIAMFFRKGAKRSFALPQ